MNEGLIPKAFANSLVPAKVELLGWNLPTVWR